MCSNDKEACISNVLCNQEDGNDRIWNLRFHRDFHERELGAACSFLELIQSWIPRGGGSDTSRYCLKGNGKFDTRYYYNIIMGAAACGSSSPPLFGSSLSVGLYASDLWDTMGHARFCGKLGVLLEFWVGKI